MLLMRLPVALSFCERLGHSIVYICFSHLEDVPHLRPILCSRVSSSYSILHLRAGNDDQQHHKIGIVDKTINCLESLQEELLLIKASGRRANEPKSLCNGPSTSSVSLVKLIVMLLDICGLGS